MNIARLSVVGALVVLAGCNQQTTVPATGADAAAVAAAAAAAKPIATVNGQTLTTSQFDFFTKSVAGKPPGELNADQRTQALDTLVRAEVVAQQAEKDGLDKQGDTPSSLTLARLQILEQAAMTRYLKDRKATDAELKAEYDTQVAAMPKTQYKARHILVKTKIEADKVLADLKKGAKFDKLATERSLDGSKTNGGDLGWFSPTNMVKPFADAVAALKKGETTSSPVQTEYGFHIIRLEDTRETAPPVYDSVKDRLTQIVDAKKFKAYGDGLISAAKIVKTP